MSATNYLNGVIGRHSLKHLIPTARN